MAKNPIQEKLTQIHKLDITGILNADDPEMLVEIEDELNPVKLQELFKKFNGQNVSISITNKTELTPEEVENEGDEEE